MSKPILITGSHRSGSTWVGKMLATSPSVIYIHEPFNGMCRPGICNAQFPYKFMYITKDNESLFYSSIKDTLSFRYNLKAEAALMKTPRDAMRLVRDYLRFVQGRLLGNTPLLKDPMALLSAQWLAERFDMNVLILIRHPAAFVSSCKQLRWGFNFAKLLNQGLLMQDYLYPFESEIKDITHHKYDLVDRCALFWKLVYYVVDQFNQINQAREGWMSLRYEDICLQPLTYFETIVHSFQIDLPQNFTEILQEHTQHDSYQGARQEVHTIKRNSQSNIEIWKQRLTPEEIQRIRDRVEGVSQNFYSDTDW